uniref:Uncharacterized protein n=1 Tax=Anguilla anguilla TaxID=7936 RepID=A0A0E9XVJ8_ANGAN
MNLVLCKYVIKDAHQVSPCALRVTRMCGLVDGQS